MPTTRKTGRERISSVDKEIAAVIAKKKAIMKDEKEKIEKKIKNKYFTSFNKAERTDFHILKGKYAETKLKQEKGTVDDFEALIDELIEESAVKIIIDRHEEKIKARLEEEKKQNDDNYADVSQSENPKNNTDVSKSANDNNDIDFSKAETVENNIDVKTENNNTIDSQDYDYDLIANVTKRMEE